MTFKNSNEFDRIAIVTYSETADQETSSDHYASRFSGAVGSWFLAVQATCYGKLLSLPYLTTRKSVLEVGGGHGQLIDAVLARGDELTVISSDASCMHRIKDYVANGMVTFEVGDFLALPFSDCSFDTVTAIRLVTHANDWQRLIGEFCRVANGTVIIDYPSKRSFNIFYSLLYPLKKSSEKTTRPFVVFSDKQIRDEFLKHTFVKTKTLPQFFLPMVVYRKLGNVQIAQLLESIFSFIGLTALFGSPTLIAFTRVSKEAKQIPNI